MTSPNSAAPNYATEVRGFLGLPSHEVGAWCAAKGADNMKDVWNYAKQLKDAGTCESIIDKWALECYVERKCPNDIGCVPAACGSCRACSPQMHTRPSFQAGPSSSSPSSPSPHPPTPPTPSLSTPVAPSNTAAAYSQRSKPHGLPAPVPPSLLAQGGAQGGAPTPPLTSVHKDVRYSTGEDYILSPYTGHWSKNEFANRYADADAKVDQLRIELSKLRVSSAKETDALKGEVRGLQGQCADYRTTIKLFEDSLEGEVTRVRQGYDIRLEKREEVIASLQKDCKTYNAQIQTLVSKLAVGERRIVQLYEENVKFSATNQDLQQLVEKQAKQITSLEAELAEQRAQIGSLQDVNDAFTKDQGTACASNTEEVDRLEGLLAASQAHIQGLEQGIKWYKDEASKVRQSMFDGYEQEHKENVALIAALKKGNADKAALVAELEGRLAKEQEESALQGNNEEVNLTSSVVDMQQKYEEGTLYVLADGALVCVHQISTDDLSVLDSYKTLQASYEDLQIDFTDLQAKYRKLRISYNSLRKVKVTLQKEHDTLVAGCATAASIVQMGMAEMQRQTDADEDADTADALRAEIERLGEEVAGLKKNLQEAKDLAEDAVAENTRLAVENNDLKGVVDAWNAKYASMVEVYEVTPTPSFTPSSTPSFTPSSTPSSMPLDSIPEVPEGLHVVEVAIQEGVDASEDPPKEKFSNSVIGSMLSVASKTWQNVKPVNNQKPNAAAAGGAGHKLGSSEISPTNVVEGPRARKSTVWR